MSVLKTKILKLFNYVVIISLINQSKYLIILSIMRIKYIWCDPKNKVNSAVSSKTYFTSTQIKCRLHCFEWCTWKDFRFAGLSGYSELYLQEQPPDMFSRARSLVVCDLRSETKDSQSNRAAAGYVRRLALCSNCSVNVEVSVNRVEVVDRS